MRRAVLRSFVLVALCASAAFAGAPSLAPGNAAPRFLLEPASGDPYTLAAFSDRPLVINVFASWCPPCRLELPGIVAAARANRGRVAFLGVDEQEPLTMGEAFAREMHIPYPVAFDHGQFAASYGARALPETIFIDRKGRIAAIVHGPVGARELAADLAKIARL